MNFLSADDLRQLDSNTFYSPTSTLISPSVSIGKNNIFYPNVIIECGVEGSVTIGDDNVFYPGIYITSTAGSITIGDDNEFGPAGVTIKANTSDAKVEIGSHGRFTDGPSIMGRTMLGGGSQVLGSITVQNCMLDAGGSFKESDPDKRAAVLKGFGLARGVTLGVGEVINGAGNFSESPIERQSSYHPKPTQSQS